MKKMTGLILALTLLLGAIMILPIHGEAGIYDNVIRLHVLANSDSEGDQALKLKVRDAVLAQTRGLLEGVEDKESAERIVRASLPQIKAAAERTVLAEGSDATVSVSLTREEYPRRTYESVALPAGEYLSLQVKLGDAQGKNWWCVLFPPLCLSAATADKETTCLSAGLTDEQYRLITDSDSGKYKLRFKILEVAQELFG